MAFNNKTKTLEPNKTSAQKQNEIMRSKMAEYGIRRPETMSGDKLRSAFVSAYNLKGEKRSEGKKGGVEGIKDFVGGLING